MASLPLETVDDRTLICLTETLWSWQLCSGCKSSQPCVPQGCPGQRLLQLKRYFKYYRGVVLSYVNECPSTQQTFKTHGDLFRAIAQLRANPDITRANFCNAIRPPHVPSHPDDMMSAITLTVKVMLMIDCSPLHHASDRLEKGTFRLYWRDDAAFSKYLQDLLATQSHPILSYEDNEEAIDMKSDLQVTKLQSRLGLTFRATHDIQNHMRLDRRQNVLEIYHHTAFLKEQLRVSKIATNHQEPSGFIALGVLPQQFLLETLDSIQGILFPLSDAKSQKLLRSLIHPLSLDPDISHFEYSSIRREGEENVKYVFLADRLSELYSELQNPRPRRWLERQLERKSGARYMMMATLIGVVFAVLVGAGSLAVSSYQIWIAYQAWQHPVVQPS